MVTLLPREKGFAPGLLPLSLFTKDAQLNESGLGFGQRRPPDRASPREEIRTTAKQEVW